MKPPNIFEKLACWWLGHQPLDDHGDIRFRWIYRQIPKPPEIMPIDYHQKYTYFNLSICRRCRTPQWFGAGDENYQDGALTT